MDAASAYGCCGATALLLLLLSLDCPNMPSIIGKIDCPKGLNVDKSNAHHSSRLPVLTC